ncbi:MAG: hypothetical protein QOF00_4544, partial [Pseudonocardiales bacterium]|nr:hypothetical protein [Pseudonocardiales bacterium]
WNRTVLTCKPQADASSPAVSARGLARNVSIIWTRLATANASCVR